MYINVSDEFKEIVKSNSITAVAKLVFTAPNITIEGGATDEVASSLQDVVITDSCYDSGQLIGTAMTKEVEINIINKDNLDLADKEFELYVGVKLSSGEYEYIPYGNYIVTEYEDTKSNNIFNLVAYDYMTKLNTSFNSYVQTKDTSIDTSKTYYVLKKDSTGTYNYVVVEEPVIKDIEKYYELFFYPTFPISLKEFKQQFITACGLEYVEQDLPNDDFSIEAMPRI